MIHIRFGEQPPSQAWLEKAKKITGQLDSASSDAERKEIIDDNADLCGELKTWLLSFSHGKCWFSESRDTYSHWDVEHFRPKIKAKNLEGAEREGYWWLAFDWRNYRICGNVGNRKKGGFFPLHPDSQVANSSARHLVKDEIFLLLDPTRPGDAELLSFDEEGKATVMPGLNGWPAQRASESIKRFKLNEHEPLREARQRHWIQCRTLIEQARDALESVPPSATDQERSRAAFEELHSMLRPEAIFSAVARECLNVSGYRWAQRIAST